MVMRQTHSEWRFWLVLNVLFLLVPLFAYAHRSGCHRWHSCPSDRGTYVCGDLGYCSQCPDNFYCQGGTPRPRSSPSRPKAPPTSLFREDIQQAQKQLQVSGYDPGPLDGMLGSQTKAALRAYQADHNIPVTGALDNATRRALGVR